MSGAQLRIGRRELLQLGIAGAAGACGSRTAAQSGLTISVREFGAVPRPGHDNSRAIQRAIDEVQSRGGGTVEIPGRYECGILVISGDGVTLRGSDGWLVNGRVVIPEGRQGCHIESLGIVNRRGDANSFALDVSGRNCSFTNVTLVKEPIAGGYQMYLRQRSSGCRFSGLRLKGSNGVMVAGRDHLFERFEFESTMSDRLGGDDAFAIKALNEPTANIVIRDGVVRGFYAIASFGSEIGTEGRSSNHEAFVRNVAVTDVTADRCGSLAFFKPGALIYDWRSGLVEEVRLERLQLNDERGERFTSGVRMIAGRGAIIRGVVGRALDIRARAKSQGVLATAAIDLSILEGAQAQIENIDLQMTFTDPYDGAEHGPAAPGYPVDHIVRIEKANPQRGSISGVNLDVVGRGSGSAGSISARGWTMR